MSLKLTEGAIKDILSGVEVESPVFQVLNFKLINASSERYRIQISDGKYFTSSSMLATQLNNLVNTEFTPLSVFEVQRYVVNSANPSKKIMILLDLKVLATGEEVGQKIGDPVSFEISMAKSQDSIPPKPQTNTSFGASSGKTGGVPSGVHPIASLTPYQNKWSIQVRVTNKSNIRTWSNSKGQGKLFSMDLLDESGEIRATAFNDQCDKFYDMIEVDKVYTISQAQLKTANKQFSSLKNDYEMTFSHSTQVSLCHDADNVPTLKFDFVSIGDLEEIPKDSIIDVIGVCKSAAELDTIVQKTTGKELKKKDLQIMDESGKEVRLTLWGTQAENFNGSLNPIVALKGAKVSDFNGKSLSCLSNSTFQINPDITESHRLRAWFDNTGCNLETSNISGQRGSFGNVWSTFKPIGVAIAENLGCRDQADYYTSKVVPTLIRKENCLYAACPSDACNKKVIDMSNDVYRCEKCNKEYDSFNWRLLLNICLTDGTGNVWATVFQDQAEMILGTSAQQMGMLKEQDENAFRAIFDNAVFKEYIVKIRVKMETYNDESRLKSTVVSLQPLDSVDYGRFLLGELK